MEENVCPKASLAALPPELAVYHCWLLAFAAHQMNTRVGCDLRALGLSFRSFAVLTVLSGESTPSQLQLAHRVGLDKTTMMATLDELEKDGLVIRGRSKKDRRVNVIQLTHKGRSRLTRARSLIDAKEMEALAGLTAGEGKQLFVLLSKLGESLNASLPAAGSCV